MGFLTSLSSWSQTVTMHGTIVDGQTLDKLIGVHVYSGENGTTSDIDGNFHISALIGDTLRISMVGYEPVMLAITDSTELNAVIISMKFNATLLRELEIVDYFQANTVIKMPEKTVYRVPGVKYPKDVKLSGYSANGKTPFSLYRAALTMSRRDFKQHKKLYEEFDDKTEYESQLKAAKTKLRNALKSIGESLDEYYLVDFIQFTGMTVATAASRSEYELAKILPGEVQRFYEYLESKSDSTKHD